MEKLESMKDNDNNTSENNSSISANKVDGEFNLKACEEALPTAGTSFKHETDKDDESASDEYSDAKDLSDETDEELDIDDEGIAENHKNLSDEQLEKLKQEAIILKNDGNEHFKKADYTEAQKLYTRALNTCPLKYQEDRAILYANRAAARINLDKKEEAVLDCNKALELNPNYLKALLRRAQLYQKMDNLDRSLEDYQKVLELDKNNAEARQACATLPAEIAERNEKLKKEMFGKLKELGNLCLKPFGLSTANFNVVQDPSSGSYSVNFQNNGS